ncbi:23S rRNA (uracil747-C5)-methyltransferase [Nocardioides daedukensis]|uniref:23S rRNA (Uracil747-C5)-methyltransferase n=1 Tax=Nocardioides daedukensis TaxID=634462 RepID=A0A7Y9UT96_9ACTN|nr:methyltransferase domain-containing protein [Nocardioides daedukensis]NYG57614.1 23S rRNA (uracil747-C5)-methyltransferase [Nocardioides daedukensis]
MGEPYADQVRRKHAVVAGILGAELPWSEPTTGPESGFRNKAKLVVGGRRGAPTLGILDGQQRGVDLTRCGLYEPGLADIVQRLPQLVTDLELTPYDVPARTGELKHLLITHSPDGEAMIRFVLRSRGQATKIAEKLDIIRAALPEARVVSINLQPEHKAILEGPEEIVLTEHDALPMRVNDVVLQLRTQSFFQTNTHIAAALYAQAREWTSRIRPETVLDLYCGVGGFALHALGHGARRVIGVEVSGEAIRSARQSASQLAAGTTYAHDWHVGDATEFLTETVPDLVVVNPPRRGIGADLARRLDDHGPTHVLYSSCNVTTLARDMTAMGNYRIVSAGLFDMFPQTDHHEVMVLLARTS